MVGNVCRDVKTAPLCPDDRLFHDGETPTDSIVETIGGGGANSALFCGRTRRRRRGLPARWATTRSARRLEQALIDRGVASFIRRDSEVQTGSSVVLTFTNGCRHFISHQSNNYNLTFSDIDLGMLADGGHLLRADVWFSESMLAGGNAQILQAARDRGLATSLDLNWDPCWGSASEERILARKEAVRQILPLVDLVHGNVRELNCLRTRPKLRRRCSG